jgi:cell division protein FtsA
MDTRIGYPNEHLAGNSNEEISSPLYATAVGLVMNSIANQTQSAYKIEVSRPTSKSRNSQIEEPKAEILEAEIVKEPESTLTQVKKSFIDKYMDKIKDFLDNAE